MFKMTTKRKGICLYLGLLQVTFFMKYSLVSLAKIQEELYLDNNNNTLITTTVLDWDSNFYEGLEPTNGTVKDKNFRIPVKNGAKNISKVEKVTCQPGTGIQVLISVPGFTPDRPYIERHADDEPCQATEVATLNGRILYKFHLPKLASCGMIPVRKNLFYNVIVVPINKLRIELGLEAKLYFVCRLFPTLTRTVGSGVSMNQPGIPGIQEPQTDIERDKSSPSPRTAGGSASGQEGSKSRFNQEKTTAKASCKVLNSMLIFIVYTICFIIGLMNFK